MKNTEINDGGPAFPIAGFIGDDGNFIEMPIQGMSLRDWFAGKALQGFASNPNNQSWTLKEIASDAYAYADEMLKHK